MDADSRAKDSTFRSRARASFSSSTTLAPLQVVSRINFSLCFFFQDIIKETDKFSTFSCFIHEEYVYRYGRGHVVSQSHLNHLAVIYTVMYQEDKFDSSCGLYDFMII
jgi:hypothetical protein